LYNAKKRRQRAYQWRDELAKIVYSKTVPVEDWRFGVTGDPKARMPRFDDSKWQIAPPGQSLGKINEFVWLRNTVTVPREFAGGEVMLHINLEAPGALFGQRGLVFVDGEESVGLDRLHKEALLTRRARAGQKFSIAVEVYTGPMKSFKLLDFGAQRSFLSKTAFGAAELRLVNRDGWRAYHDFDAGVDILDALTPGSRVEAEVLAAIDSSIDCLDLRADEPARSASFRAASAVLTRRVFSGQKGNAAGKVLIIGQSHIDMAWLWPRAETIRKCASTMANTLSLQKEYSFYRFSHSQAQGFQWLKDSYPSLYARTRRAARADRVEAMGGMWVEADLNCAGGEALARQFLYGQHFFQKEFGTRCRVGWLIDTFGYSWGMPQILKESGLDYFVSTKPTWNDTNTFPFTFFWWEGPDGSRVLTHIPPRTYGDDVTLKAINDALEKDKEARLGVAPALLFGESDGGGGPRVTDVERIPRLMASPYAPEIEICNVTEYFDQLSKTAKYPVFADEMYVETHRGTYTTQARTKRNNRKAECALYTAEAAAAAATVLGARYPKADLEAAWKLVLFNQFHDILPGSSIPLVYEDAERDYAKVFAATGKVTSSALSFLGKHVDTKGPGKAVLVFNPSAWERTGVVEIDAPAGARRVVDCEGRDLPLQAVSGRKGRLAVLVTVPPCGWKVIRILEGRPPRSEPVARVAGREIETELFSVRFNAQGQLARVYDKAAAREVLAKGAAGNRFELLEDIPTEYEAWDIDEWADDKTREVKDLVSFDVIENGPLRVVARLVWKANRSTITQRVILYAHTRRIDFATQVDWRERKTLLKAAFPLSVRSRRATYEIAFGAIDRSTNESNPWDWARFEVPAHKWADLSQADYGASILNDSKYGYDTKGSVMRLSLLRSPESPGVDTDRGRQEFTYSLLPHAGDWRAAGTVKEAFDLNVPLAAEPVASTAGVLPPEGWLVRVEADDGAPVVLSALKAAEDGDGLIARIYEPHGRDARVTLRTSFGTSRAERVNFLEETTGKLRHRSNSVTLDLSPWKIATLRLALEK
jgi:alpha-mannosidase